MMEFALVSFALGIVLGWFICMFKVIELQSQLSEIRIDLLHESNKEAVLRKLCKEQGNG
ncbi:MAG: hypothetical protein HRU18_09545 [Pseudoalteromonas sp.]|uniref:hypothetical protein n=1 Tax=Pseudoalteromonas sp. TaxID=53249 RepID=UPI001D53D987|nr:hypothetical protein [Pseudoalteromonas sp.]NRA78439.1 hypothetical protein [Pseudoalteromonas sp.]